MSLYEPKSVETNEASLTHHDRSHSSPSARTPQAAELVFRLPDLDQWDRESENSLNPEQEDSSWDAQLDPQKADKPSFLRSRRSLRSEKATKRKVYGRVAGMLLAAGLLGFVAARITDSIGLYGGGPTHNELAPDASKAAPYEKPHYASDKTSPKNASPFDLPGQLTPPSLDSSNSGSFSAGMPGTSGTIPSSTMGNPSIPTTPTMVPDPAQVASPSISPQQTPIPIGPDVQQNPAFTYQNQAPVEQNPAFYYQNPAYPSQNPAYTAQNQVYAPSPVGQGNVPPQVGEADRFSPERIQEVLRSQQGSVQTIQYPQTSDPNSPSANYPGNYPSPSVPIVAQRQVPTSYPQPESSYPPPQGSQAMVPPVSPYPPANNEFSTPPNHTSQSWPAEQTMMPPSTSPQNPQMVYPQGYQQGYPQTGYPVTNTAAQPATSPNPVIFR